MNAVSGKKVYVGLSGGVDSAVSAALLKDQGAHVTGVFIKGWYPPGMPCTWAEDRRDAMRVAARLHIPFLTLDAAEEYKRSVIDYLLEEYRLGRTPNPDIMCNREVKFGAFWRFAKEQGADAVATGHYARQEHGVLMRGVDTAKDQSYFLWAVPKAVLEETVFPLGTMHKEETRMRARDFRLPNATKKDSQGVCFLGAISLDDFLKQEISCEPGKAVDVEGVYVGQHAGAVLNTLGERVALQDAPPGPWYVLRKDLAENVLTVSHEKSAPTAQTIQLKETNWFTEDLDNLEAQYRYHGPRVLGSLSEDRSAFIPSAALEEEPAPGQSLVLYRGDVCVGGGTIG